MATKKIPITLKNVIRHYIQSLQEDDTKISRVILFGSFAKGDQDK